MPNNTNSQNSGQGEENDPQHGAIVQITINDQPYDVHRGRQTVAYLKEIAGISQSYELDEVEDGRLVPLADDGAVTIKGDEVFKSNLKVGHSS